MKKIVSLMMAVLMMATMLTGCGGGSELTFTTGSETGTGDAGTGDTETGSTETPETESSWWRLDITGMPPEEDDEQLVFNGYTNEDEQAELLVGEPYDSMYVHWLAAMIDWNNREYDSYNNENAMFEAEYGAFRNAFNRTHMPKQTRKIYF